MVSVALQRVHCAECGVPGTLCLLSLEHGFLQLALLCCLPLVSGRMQASVYQKWSVP